MDLSNAPLKALDAESQGPRPMQVTGLPLVTIVITNYNYEKYILKAIESVKAQTYPNLECVIVDDCSIDRSFEIVMDYLQKNPDERFRCLRLGKNSGQLAACKVGYENSSGAFVTFLDSDDLLLPEFAAEHVKVHLNTSFAAAFTSSDMMLVDDAGSALQATYYSMAKHRSDAAGGKVVIPEDAVPSIEDSKLCYKSSDRHRPVYSDRSEFGGWHYVAMSAMMFRRGILDIIMRQDTEIGRLNADYYLAMYAHALSGVLLMGSFHSLYRIHGSNGFSTNAVMGGSTPLGNFDAARKQRIEFAISEHAVDNFSMLAKLIGYSQTKRIATQWMNRGQLYSRLKHNPGARHLLVGRSYRKYRLKKFFYRLYRK